MALNIFNVYKSCSRGWDLVFTTIVNNRIWYDAEAVCFLFLFLCVRSTTPQGCLRRLSLSGVVLPTCLKGRGRRWSRYPSPTPSTPLCAITSCAAPRWRLTWPVLMAWNTVWTSSTPPHCFSHLLPHHTLAVCQIKHLFHTLFNQATTALWTAQRRPCMPQRGMRGSTMWWEGGSCLETTSCSNSKTINSLNPLCRWQSAVWFLCDHH